MVVAATIPAWSRGHSAVSTTPSTRSARHSPPPEPANTRLHHSVGTYVVIEETKKVVITTPDGTSSTSILEGGSFRPSSTVIYSYAMNGDGLALMYSVRNLGDYTFRFERMTG